MDWIDLAQDRDRCGLLWMQQQTFRFHKMQVISWLAEDLSAPQEGLCSMKLVNISSGDTSSF
jgi:hypothetical protein